ncbi:CreA family protein [Shigella flexneri]
MRPFLVSKSGPLNCRIVLKTAKSGPGIFAMHVLVFKSLQVVRFYDAKRNALAYLAYSTSQKVRPKNAISAVPVMPWRQYRGHLCNGKRSG